MAEESDRVIYFLMPVFNEQDNIQRLISDISGYASQNSLDHTIILSDDGSSDKTVELARDTAGCVPLKLVSNPVNMGPGAAFDNGFREILKTASSGDIVVTMEADNTSDLSIIKKMLQKIKEGNDLVLASCYAREGKVVGITAARKILSKGANIITGFFWGRKGISTFSSFYRCYTVDILNKAYDAYGDSFIREKGFVCAAEIFIKLSRLGARITEVPMILMCQMRIGRSKMKTLKTTLSYLRLFLREGMRINDAQR